MGICQSIISRRQTSNNHIESIAKPIKQNFNTTINEDNNNRIIDNTMDYHDPNRDFDDNAFNIYDKTIKDDSSEGKDETNDTINNRTPALYKYLPNSIKDSSATNNSIINSMNSNQQEELFKKGDIMSSDYFLTKLGAKSNIFSSVINEKGETPLSESYASQNNNKKSGYNQIGYINKSMESKSNYENRINTSIHGSYADISQSAYLYVPREDQAPAIDIGGISESMLQSD